MGNSAAPVARDQQRSKTALATGFWELWQDMHSPEDALEGEGSFLLTPPMVILLRREVQLGIRMSQLAHCFLALGLICTPFSSL